MMNLGLEIVLLGFALIGFVGTGASLAVARYRALEDGSVDLGMLGVAAMLCGFGAICTSVAVGLYGVFGIGAIVVWASYVIMARQIGMFLVEVALPAQPAAATESQHHLGSG
jgi:hypothetical protein